MKGSPGGPGAPGGPGEGREEVRVGGPGVSLQSQRSESNTQQGGPLYQATRDGLQTNGGRLEGTCGKGIPE